ncbi:hypothetical protein [Caballeronia zhejiangensis]|uniref:hypothetical protein n=1 Tax=Caballeronia zhejiangensis TaxID=871203 RepID=UPI001EF5C6DF|nr:hypothetical protein [Caballeronia zhejiangensis]MCG7405486.1 hypothetical protein [Caballeronia zhejiangensis]
MPLELAFDLDDLELIVVHFSDNARLPVIVDLRDLADQIDGVALAARDRSGGMVRGLGHRSLRSKVDALRIRMLLPVVLNDRGVLAARNAARDL